MKKTLPLLLLCLFSLQMATAQFYKTVLPTATFSDSLAVIVQDFKRNFTTIQGKQLNSRGEMDVYQSRVSVPGALHSAVYRFHSLEDTTDSWQAIMYEGESYEAAVKVYKQTYKQLKKAKMKWVDKSIISFMSELEMPDESIRFTVTTLRLNIIDLPYRSFFGEIELTNTYDGWEVHLNLHSKKNDASRY